MNNCILKFNGAIGIAIHTSIASGFIPLPMLGPKLTTNSSSDMVMQVTWNMAHQQNSSLNLKYCDSWQSDIGICSDGKKNSCLLNTSHTSINKANLRDLIAATGLVVISNWIQIVDFSAHVTLKFDGWPWKTIGHFFYNTLNFVHHFKAMGEFKLELQSGNAQLGSKSAIFYPMWPWNLMDDLENQ